MSGTDAALEHLASAAGIEPAYRDTGGIVRPTTPETARAILTAMGFEADSDAGIVRSLARLRDLTEARPLPPVIVTRPGRLLPLPQAPDGAEWRISLEEGGTLSGRLEAKALMLPADLPTGYHRLEVAGSEAPLIATPGSAYLPPWLERGERRWGIACSLFSLSRDGGDGIGDFTDLKTLANEAAVLGALTIGINPLHALAPADPEQANPYWPSSRLYLNPIHLDPRAIDLGAVPADPTCGTTIDYGAVWTHKRAVLETLYRRFGGDPGFDAFCVREGDRLDRFALFSALAETHPGLDWHDWPADLRSPDAPGIAQFRAAEADRIRFHAWLQWQAVRQLAAASAPLADRDEAAGFYGDLAVGVSPHGADAWADQRCYAIGARFGAPPDGFTPAGQDWGMPPPHPVALVEAGYAPFIAALRANMRQSRLLRIDHVMGLARLYWIPRGAPAKEGAYVRYPFEDLIGIVALESRRNRCLVIGEDLGTVPDGFRDRLAEANILSYRVLIFERWENGLYRRPETYPALALATSGTHDLPSFISWWRGNDIVMRDGLKLLFAASLEEELVERQNERALLISALSDQGLVPSDFPAAAALDEIELGRLIAAAQAFLARTPAALMMINLPDLFAESIQINLPGTVHEHPNWRHRSARPVAGLASDPLVASIIAAIRAQGRR